MDQCIKTPKYSISGARSTVSILVLMDLCIKTDNEDDCNYNDFLFQSLF